MTDRLIIGSLLNDLALVHDSVWASMGFRCRREDFNALRAERDALITELEDFEADQACEERCSELQDKLTAAQTSEAAAIKRAEEAEEEFDTLQEQLLAVVEEDWDPVEYIKALLRSREASVKREIAERNRADAAEQRAEGLAARVEALKQVADEMLYQFSEPTHPGEECRRSGHVRLSTITAWRGFLDSTPAADLSAHDDWVRREALGTGGVEAIAAERKRQIEVEGWTPEHDDEHGLGEMSGAAVSYIMADHIREDTILRHWWPWSRTWWKPKDRRSNLVRAGALIAAEIDRVDRFLGTAPETEGEK